MTGLFGGAVDLGTPEQRVRKALTLEMESRRNRWTDPSTYYRGGTDLVLRHGEFRMGRPLPETYEHLWAINGVTCFLNALEACEADPSLRYCEGYATSGSGMPLLHAWCLAPDDGVLDVTWPCRAAELEKYACQSSNLPFLRPTTWGYWGVVLRPELARWSVETFREAGLLNRTPAEYDSWSKSGYDPAELIAEHGHPILNVPYNPERTSL